MRTVQKLSVFARFLPDHETGKKADICRSVKPSGSFGSCINKFLKFKTTVDKHSDAKWGDAQHALKFRTNVKCDDCDTAKQIWNSLAKDNKTLQTLIKTCHYAD